MRARDNPFRSARIDALAFRDPDVTPEALLERWTRAGRRGALVGPHGSGKTTLLGALESGLERAGRRVVSLRLGRDDRAIPMRAIGAAVEACARDAVLCLDGFDLLPWWARLRVRRALQPAYGVLVTSHRACAIPTLHRTRTSPALLGELVDELVGPDAARLAPSLAALYARCDGNVRDAMFALYQAVAADERPSPSRPRPHRAPEQGAPDARGPNEARRPIPAQSIQ